MILPGLADAHIALPRNLAAGARCHAIAAAFNAATRAATGKTC
jgi:hypothetical protein